jgi:methyl-accepting chemotaxis protein
MRTYLSILLLTLCVSVVLLAAIWRIWGRGLIFKIMVLQTVAVLAAQGVAFSMCVVGVNALSVPAGIVLCGAGVLGIAWLAQRILVAPVQKIGAAAEHIAQADLKNLSDVIEAVAGGNLTKVTELRPQEVSIASHDELGGLAAQLNQTTAHVSSVGKALDGMTAKLRSMFGDFSASADKMSRASGDIAHAAEETTHLSEVIATDIQGVESGIDEQNRGLSSASASVDQVAGAIQEVADGAQGQATSIAQITRQMAQIEAAIDQMVANAESAVAASERVTGTAHAGSSAIGETIQSMNDVGAAIGRIKEKIDLMGQRSERIRDIVETIDEIAAQTNLLALNAAIEAARAGENGRGFAVVAEEVRKLAAKSAGAVQEIAELAGGIRESVADVAHAMPAVESGNKTGTERSVRAGEALTAIVGAAEDGTQAMRAISGSTREVQAAVDGLMSAANEVTAIVEKNTASAEEMAANASQMSETLRTIAGVSEQNSAALLAVRTSIEGMRDRMESIKEGTCSLSDVANTLQHNAVNFKVKAVSGKVSRGVALTGRLRYVIDRFGQAALDRVLRRLDDDSRRILKGRIDDNGEYPPELLGALTDAIKKELGNGSDDILRDMTRYRAQFDVLPGSDLARYFRAGDPGYIIHKMDLCLRKNWGEGVIVRNFDVGPNHVRMEVDMGKKQPRERCTYNHVGWMEGVIDASGGVPYIKKTKCMYDGDPFCEYDVRWEMAAAPGGPAGRTSGANRAPAKAGVGNRAGTAQR